MKKRSVGQYMVLLGILIISAGLLLNGFEIISTNVFRIIVLIGIIVDVAALFVIWKKSEF